MPVEVLTREELDKIVNELKKKIMELESSIIDLRKRIPDLPVVKSKAADTELIAQALLKGLGERSKLLEINVRGDSITLRAKRYLDARILERSLMSLGDMVDSGLRQRGRSLSEKKS